MYEHREFADVVFGDVFFGDGIGEDVCQNHLQFAYVFAEARVGFG